MNLSGMFKKPAGKAESEFPDLTDNMADMIDLELDAPSIAMESDDVIEAAPSAEEQPEAEAEKAETQKTGDSHRLTSYTQSRLAALSAFDELHRGSDEDLRQFGAILSRVQAAHHSTREFLSTMHTSIYRANELELAHAQMLSENRKLSQQVEQVKRIRSQHESLIETYKRRETKLIQDCDTLKVELGRVGLEANDTTNRIGVLERERAELLNTMAVKSSNAERHARENEVLREKQVNLSLDLENTQRRHTETERKFGELSAIREVETAQLSELRTKIVGAEKEVYRLQKQHDAVNARLEEAQESLDASDSQMDDLSQRHETETQKLKSEITSLKSRLEAADKAQLDWSNELGAAKQKLAEAVSEKKIAEDRLAAVKRDFETERKALSANATEAAQSSLEHQSDSILLEVHTEEVDKLRREIETLKATVDKLGRYERIYSMVKSRRAQKADKPDEEDDDTPVAKTA